MKYLYNKTSNLRCSLSWHKIISSKLFTTDFILKQKRMIPTRKHFSMIRTTRLPTVRASVAMLPDVTNRGTGAKGVHVSCPGGGGLGGGGGGSMSHVRGASLNRSPVIASTGIQCIMGNAHMGMPLVDRQTRMKTLPSHSKYELCPQSKNLAN